MMASNKNESVPVVDTPTTEATAEPTPTPIKVGTGGAKAHVVTDGNMSAEEKAKLQGMIGNANAQDTRAFVGQKNVTQDVTDITHKNTVVFTGCTDCSYTLKAYCTKVFVQGCTNFTLIIDSKVITSTAEVYKSDNVELHFNTKIATVQLDICNTVKCVYKAKDVFDHIFWAGVESLQVVVNDPFAVYNTSYSTFKAQDDTLVFERSQFKTHFLNNKLQTEKVIRLANGFPSTLREKTEFERREEDNINKLQDEMFKDLNIRMNRKVPDGPKVGRNEKCPCSSGKKYKSCCGKFA
ncbi:hypothetical protein SARC_08316 [Sphaeroforma arctica JP610]|uniref:Adenylate cyclase-associated CAP C-terminal domain-containing protein n=1 Tax=Sphaeroforma arctica JP610 TaxID=667725 RepID=A0A0L0FRG6_9EUKA|nr:hypothetical protein SARC_08316 [Sphaeroforma arctica JP610]KNC79284.1 hypothetical protein SARC_08316 [Sphaeroforma arctica JP610]|eukprot:XP_014153186.1 hypothetical protein SARC_08316 [Sphaeroforma arctica JP610]